MGKEVSLEVTETPPDTPSSPVIVQQPNPEQIIQAAILTGEASQRAKEAAETAEESEERIKSLLRASEAVLSGRMETMEARLAALEELTTPDDPEDIPETVTVNVAEIEEPESLTPPAIDQPEPPQAPERGGIFRRIFLNL